MVGIRNFKTTICLTLALLTTGMEGKLKSSVKTSLQKIKTSLTSAGQNVQSRVDKISNYLESEKGGSDMETLSSSLETIGGAVSSLTSADPTQIVGSALDMISAVTSVIPVAGPIISTVFSLIGTIFGSIAGGGAAEDVGTIVAREIDKALNKYEDSQLRAEAAGAMRVFSVSHAYLASKKGDAPMMKHEIAALAANVPVYQGIEFLGILAAKVRENSKSNNADDVKRAMEYIQLYVILAVLRSSTLWELYAVLRAAPDSAYTAEAIHRVIEAEDRTDVRFLKFLAEPHYSQAIFFAYFDPSKWPQTMKFLEKKGLDYQRHGNLATGEHYLRAEKYPNLFLYMKDDSAGTMIGSKTFNDQSQFVFISFTGEDNVFLIKPLKWFAKPMYMQEGSKGWCSGWNMEEKFFPPGPQGDWKVIKFKDGKYMLSPKKWPNWFMFMTDDGYVRGMEGDPGTAGHWTIETAMSVVA